MFYDCCPTSRETSPANLQRYGWITGMRLGSQGQTPIAVEGTAASAHSDKAVAVHLKVPKDKMVNQTLTYVTVE